MTRLIRRRDLLTGAAALTAHAALAQSITPQIGGGLNQGFDGGLGGATNPGPLAAYVGPIATRAYVPTGANYNSGLTAVMCRMSHFATDTMKDVQLDYANWFVNGVSGAETNQGGVLTINASVEYPAGVFTQVTFASSATGTVANGGLLTSDLVSLSIPKGAQFWTRTLQQNPGGVTYFILGKSANGDLLEFSNTNKTMGGTVSNGVEGFCCGPAAIRGTTKKRSVYILGTSRSYGQNDTADSSGNLGVTARSIGGAGFGYINGGIPSEQAALYKTNHAKRDVLIAYASDVYIELGPNDAVGTIQADLATVIGLYNASKRVHLVTCDPFTTPAWTNADGSDQTTITKDFTSLNSYMRGLPLTVADVLDAAAATSIVGTPTKWKAPGYTPDGLHETQLACLTIQSANQASVATSLVQPPPPAPPAALTTWDAANNFATLSELNRRLTSSGSNLGSRSTSSRATGDWYYEIEIVSAVSTAIGIGNASVTLNNWLAGNGNGIGIDITNGLVSMSGSSQGSAGIGTLTAGDVLCVKASRTSGTFQLAKNGGAYGTVFNFIPAGALYIAATMNSGGSIRIRTEASQFSYSVPGGYSAWN